MFHFSLVLKACSQDRNRTCSYVLNYGNLRDYYRFSVYPIRHLTILPFLFGVKGFR
jgi:hypothetical protein